MKSVIIVKFVRLYNRKVLKKSLDVCNDIIICNIINNGKHHCTKKILGQLTKFSKIGCVKNPNVCLLYIPRFGIHIVWHYVSRQVKVPSILSIPSHNVCRMQLIRDTIVYIGFVSTSNMVGPPSLPSELGQCPNFSTTLGHV